MEEDLKLEFSEETVINKLQGGHRAKIAFIINQLWDFEELRLGRVKNVKLQNFFVLNKGRAHLKKNYSSHFLIFPIYWARLGVHFDPKLICLQITPFGQSVGLGNHD